MNKKYLKISTIGIILFISVLLIGVAIYASLAYLTYGVLLTLAFPELPTLSFLQYVLLGAVITIITSLFKK